MSGSATLVYLGLCLTHAVIEYNRIGQWTSNSTIRLLRIRCIWGKMPTKSSRTTKKNKGCMWLTSYSRTVRGGRPCSVTCPYTLDPGGTAHLRYPSLRNSMTSPLTCGVSAASFTSWYSTCSTTGARTTSGRSSSEFVTCIRATPASLYRRATRMMTTRTRRTPLIRTMMKRSMSSVKTIKILSFWRISAFNLKLIWVSLRASTQSITSGNLSNLSMDQIRPRWRGSHP